MRRRLYEQTCPWCHHTFTIARDTYLIADPGSADYRRLGERTYFVHQCQHCKKLFELRHPLEYRDPAKHFEILLSSLPAEQIRRDRKDLPASWTSILCRTPDQFETAFLALDSGAKLSDVLALKQKLQAGHQKVVFCSYDASQNVYWFEIDGRPAAIRQAERSS